MAKNIVFELNDQGVVDRMHGTNSEDVEVVHANHETPLERRPVKFSETFFDGATLDCWVLGRLAFYEIP